MGKVKAKPRRNPRRAVTLVPRVPPPREPLRKGFVNAHTAVVAGAFFLLVAAALSGELAGVVADDAFEGRKTETRRFYQGWVAQGWTEAGRGAGQAGGSMRASGAHQIDGTGPSSSSQLQLHCGVKGCKKPYSYSQCEIHSLHASLEAAKASVE
jgi:hypothetical protein